jgi:hypothetical protein
MDLSKNLSVFANKTTNISDESWNPCLAFSYWVREIVREAFESRCVLLFYKKAAKSVGPRKTQEATIEVRVDFSPSRGA